MGRIVALAAAPEAGKNGPPGAGAMGAICYSQD